MIGGEPTNTYEAWVVTLRMWVKDPSTSLATLPLLTEENLPRAAYERLATHLTEALQQSTQAWEQGLLQALADSRDYHDLADRLVKLRVTLARRRQLASHPSLPEGMRSTLTGDFDRFVLRSQEQLETNLRNYAARAMLPQEMQTSLLRVIRENPLTGVQHLDLTQDGARGSVRPLNAPDPDARLAAPPRRRRTLIHE